MHDADYLHERGGRNLVLSGLSVGACYTTFHGVLLFHK